MINIAKYSIQPPFNECTNILGFFPALTHVIINFLFAITVTITDVSSVYLVIIY